MPRLSDSKGFSLVELLVAVAVVGILMGIAAAQFQNYRAKALNSAALSDLRNLQQLMESVHAERQVYPTL